MTKKEDIPKTSWSNIDALNQLMAPVQLMDSELQQELNFYANTQFRYNNSATTTTTNNNRQAYFEQQRTFQTSTGTPQLNIPADTNDYVNSNIRNETSFNIPSTSSSSSSTTTNPYNKNMNNIGILFDQQQQNSNHHGDGSILLGHEPSTYSRHIATGQPSNLVLNNTMYSNQNTPMNSSPNSPTVGIQHQHYFETATDTKHQQSTDRFATMFLSSNETKEAKPAQNASFRFKEDTKQQKQQPLDYSLLSRHNMEQDLLLSSSTPKGKNKQKVTAPAKKRASNKKQAMVEEEEEDSEEDEDEPVIGDGAQSYSSMGSNGSRSSLTKDDKRRRNTAASARFRIKKKMREQALQNTACQMTDKAKRMEQRVHELEREIKWLKALVVEKNETRIEQLVREKPINSTAFPSPSQYQNNNEFEEEEEDDHEYPNQF